MEESGGTEGEKEYYSKLVKADINGKDQVKKLSGFLPLNLFWITN